LHIKIPRRFKLHLKNRRAFQRFLIHKWDLQRRKERFGDRNIEPVPKNPVLQVAVTDLCSRPTHRGYFTSFSKLKKIFLYKFFSAYFLLFYRRDWIVLAKNGIKVLELHRTFQNVIHEWSIKNKFLFNFLGVLKDSSFHNNVNEYEKRMRRVNLYSSKRRLFDRKWTKNWHEAAHWKLVVAEMDDY